MTRNSNLQSRNPERRHQWWVWIVSSVFVASAAWFGFLRWELDPKVPGGWLYTRREHQNRISFDSKTWMAFPRSTNEWPHTDLLPVRIRMVDDLLKHHTFLGQTREDVEKLLGPKTRTEYFGDWDLVYYLGPGRYDDAIKKYQVAQTLAPEGGEAGAERKDGQGTRQQHLEQVAFG